MRSTTLWLALLLTAFTLVRFTRAELAQGLEYPREVNQRDLWRRQDEAGGGDEEEDDPPAPAPPAPTPSGPTSTSATTTEESTTTSTLPPTSSTPPPTTSKPDEPTKEPTSKPPPETKSTSTVFEDETTTSTSTTKVPTSTVVRTIKSTIIITNSKGEVSTSVTSSFSTDLLTPTGPAKLSDKDDGSKGSNGLSTKQKNTIIGVVVGVGGAVLLAGIAVVVMRLRKRRSAKRDDDLGLAGTSAHGAGTTDAMSYSKPPGHVNPSANF